ncbi:MAG: C10 family peptidase [Bacteroidales bacterium]
MDKPLSLHILIIAFVLSFGYTNTESRAQCVTPEEAITVANHFAANRLNISFIPQAPDVYTSEINGVTTYYVCNFFPDGFVIVAANKNITPVLAFSSNSHCLQNNSNPALNNLLNHYSKQGYETYMLKNHQNPENQQLWSDYLQGVIKSPKGQVEPLLTTTWDQPTYYNEFCPADPDGPDDKCVTGCVATALGQLVNYFRWPYSGTGSYTSEDTVYGSLTVNYAAAHYDFNEMAIDLTRSNPETAELIYNIGVGVDMHYGPDGSGMNNHKAAHVVKSFFKYVDSTQYIFRDSVTLNWDSVIISHLERGIPMYYAGWGDTIYMMGHAFVVDGYQDSCYFHFNWGWGGSADAYFYTNDLTPGSNFNLMQELVINMYPDGPYPYYCNGTDTVSSRDGTIDDGSGPLFGYRNNTDCSWLIAPDDSISSIELSFLRFDTETGNDILTIYDGENTSAPVLGSYSGSSIPATIESSGSRVFMTFTSNGSDSAGGFLVSYKINTPYTFCDALSIITAESDSIEDGSGQYLYHGNNFCRWKIQPTSTEPVLLTFSEFDLDSTDYVKVTDHTSGAVLGEFRGNQLPPALYSGNGTMTITLKTTATAHAQGFKCFYRTSPVSVADISKPDLMLFPNPAKDYITIAGVNSECSVIVFDTHGRRIWTVVQQPQGGHIVIPVHQLNNGMYLLSVTTNNSNYSLKFFKE